MALTVSEVDSITPKNNDPLPDPPPSDVPLTTPVGDPWPRPYLIEDGLRRVAPYYYTYNTYCKQRWRGRELLEIFQSEFRDRSAEYYKDAIAAGRVVVNGKQVPLDFRLKNGEVISHTMHRHEPPVTGQPVKVVSEDDDMIVIDKPAGVPVHPAGRYKFNSVVEIMRAERDSSFNPMPCNRLDRLTSGIMFIGKHAIAAEDVSQKLRGRTVRKEYLARVKGQFPDGDENGITVCEEDCVTVSPILGLNRVREGGKSAKTLFRRLAYYPGRNHGKDTAKTAHDGEQPTSNEQEQADKPQSNGTTAASDSKAGSEQTEASAKSASSSLPNVEDDSYSIVHCLPLTGRTHQLRVHLQFLGHPISNDPIYSNRQVFGPLLGKADSSPENDDEIIARLSQMGKTTTFSETMGTEQSQKKSSDQPTSQISTTTTPPSQTSTTQSSSTSEATPELVAAYNTLVSDYEKQKGEKMTGEVCSECGTPLYSDPGPNELGIYLHAICYRDLGERIPIPEEVGSTREFRQGGWSYESHVPKWAWPVDEGEEGKGEDRTGIREFEKWNNEWSVGLMSFDRETVVPRRMKGHQ